MGPFKGYFYSILLFQGLDSCTQLDIFSCCKFLGFLFERSSKLVLFPRVKLRFNWVWTSYMCIYKQAFDVSSNPCTILIYHPIVYKVPIRDLRFTYWSIIYVLFPTMFICVIFEQTLCVLFFDRLCVIYFYYLFCSQQSICHLSFHSIVCQVFKLEALRFRVPIWCL